MFGAAFRIGDIILFRPHRRRIPQLLGHPPGTVSIVYRQTKTFGAGSCIGADQGLGSRYGQEGARLVIKNAAGKVVGSSIPHVEPDRRVELDQFHQTLWIASR